MPATDPSPWNDAWYRDRALWVGTAVAVVLSIVQTLVRGDALWGQSDGVYAFTSRLLLHGDDLYGRLVAAQPPLTLYAGVPALAISDSLTALHLWIGLLQVAGGVGAAVAVRRLTGSAWCTGVAPVLAIGLPWAVNQHGVFLPELVGLPLLLGGAAAAARRRSAALAGVLLALAVFVKFPFALPALAVALVAADRGRTLRWLVGVGIGQAVLYTLLFGTDLWEQTLLAQGQSGLHAWSMLPGTVLQSVWTLLGVLVAGGLLLLHRDAWPADRVQLRVSFALAVGTAATWVTSLKVGTSLYVLVPFEVAMIPLALSGVAVAWNRRTDRRPLARVARVLVPAAVLLTIAQSIAVLVPPHDAFPWTRPGTSPAYGPIARQDAVDRTVRTLRASCANDAPYGGLAYYAFLANRRMPDQQPDTFLTANSEHLRGVLARMRADGPVCGG